MSLFGRKEKKQIEQLQGDIEALQQAMPDECVDLAKINRKVEIARADYEELQAKIAAAWAEVKRAKEELVETNEAVMLQSFGLYEPHYDFQRADEYKVRLAEIRAKQKDMIKAKTATTGNQNWNVNNSASKGRKMVADTQKLLLRAFNAECDDAVEHVRFSNLEASEKKITKSREAISKLGEIMAISISPQYYALKIEELYLAYEYQQKKQAEKEEQREARARLREEAKLAKEIEEARKKLEKEQSHYENALQRITEQILGLTGEKLEDALAKKAELEEQLEKINAEFAAVDYREANQRAGYVYVISNIGAFGEGVYKIGMTRRLEPMDRVDELGDASVPFNFDVHAMIFSDDAPRLEAALHNAFADRKVNFVNQRREFFRVSLDEIRKVVRENYDKTVEFVEYPPAEQYRQSILMQQQLQERK